MVKIFSQFIIQYVNVELFRIYSIYTFHTCTWILLKLRLWFPTTFGNNSLQLSWYFKTKVLLFELAPSASIMYAASLTVSDTSFDKLKLGLIRALVQNYNKLHITNQISYNLQDLHHWILLSWLESSSEFQRIHAPRMLPQNANKTSRNETKYFVLTF